MKKFNLFVCLLALFYMIMVFLASIIMAGRQEQETRGYLVEVNRVMKGLEKENSFSKPALHDMVYLREVSFLTVEQADSAESVAKFYWKKNGHDRHIEPLMQQGQLKGYVRFDYIKTPRFKSQSWLVAGAIFLNGLLVVLILLYVRHTILKPFFVLQQMPYELAKGRLNGEIKENKGRYFGDFIWGITMLRDSLKYAKRKELKLEKEKKTLLLSISHDIKTPLNTIKLYAKALAEGIYPTPEEKQRAAVQIIHQTEEMEGFLKEIVKSSSENILHIEIADGEFYLKELVVMIKRQYQEKCSLMRMRFTIGSFENKLLKGDKDRVFEAIENIIENAFKYGDGKELTITFYEEEYCQLISIQNSGIPVPVHEMPHLFDSFYRGSNAGQKDGNGLGLYICREIMKNMDGDIFAKAKADGMSFILVLR